jgi:hypothetical protein
MDTSYVVVYKSHMFPGDEYILSIIQTSKLLSAAGGIVFTILAGSKYVHTGLSTASKTLIMLADEVRIWQGGTLYMQEHQGVRAPKG